MKRLLLTRYLLRHPTGLRLKRYQSLTRWQWLKPHLEQVKPHVLPAVSDIATAANAVTPNPIELSSSGVAASGLLDFPGGYPQYRCAIGTPLNCVRASQASQGHSENPTCSDCGFPASLPEAAVIFGERGQYRIERHLGQRNIGRQYRAIREGSDVPVTLREYLLPKRYFSAAEQQQRRERFLAHVGMTLADGRTQDLRIILPLEAIAPVAEERVYLLLPVEAQAPTLNDILMHRSPLSDQAVQKVLSQVLQTLVGLHQQKYTLSLGRTQTGLVHGNIQLTTLLWVERGDDWFIYLTDFADWENPFYPQVLDESYARHQDDLKALGTVAFQLLTGTLTDRDGHRLSPQLTHHWPAVYPPLKQLILRLLSIEPGFTDAQAAYRAVCQLPPRPLEHRWALPARMAAPVKSRWWYYVTSVVLGLGLAMLGGRLLWSILQPRPLEAQNTPPACCFEAVGAVPEGRFTYTATTGDGWEALLKRTVFDAQETMPFIEELSKDQPHVQLAYQSSSSVTEAIEKVRSRQVDFAFLPLVEPIPPDMTADIVAYDGLAVVVAFNYQGRAQGLPDRLQGQLSLSTVQELFQGKISDWSQIERTLDLPVALYANGSPTTQAAMRQLRLQTDVPMGMALTQLDTIPMLRRIIRDFESAGVGGIGIAPLSEIEGQCSVYPLAIASSDRVPSQPFRHIDGASLQPRVDLCRAKGLYHLESTALQTFTYPLAYPLAIVSRYDNRMPPIGRKFAELLHTDEGQTYLKQVGLTGVE